jgi:hypothetical protein
MVFKKFIPTMECSNTSGTAEDIASVQEGFRKYITAWKSSIGMTTTSTDSTGEKKYYYNAARVVINGKAVTNWVNSPLMQYRHSMSNNNNNNRG